MRPSPATRRAAAQLQDWPEAMGRELVAPEGHRLPQLTTRADPRRRRRPRRPGKEPWPATGSRSAAGWGRAAGTVWRIGCMGHTARPRNVTLLLAALRRPSTGEHAVRSADPAAAPGRAGLPGVARGAAPQRRLAHPVGGGLDPGRPRRGRGPGALEAAAARLASGSGCWGRGSGSAARGRSVRRGDQPQLDPAGPVPERLHRLLGSTRSTPATPTCPKSSCSFPVRLRRAAPPPGPDRDHPPQRQQPLGRGRSSACGTRAPPCATWRSTGVGGPRPVRPDRRGVGRPPRRAGEGPDHQSLKRMPRRRPCSSRCRPACGIRPVAGDLVVRGTWSARVPPTVTVATPSAAGARPPADDLTGPAVGPGADHEERDGSAADGSSSLVRVTRSVVDPPPDDGAPASRTALVQPVSHPAPPPAAPSTSTAARASRMSRRRPRPG